MSQERVSLKKSIKIPLQSYFSLGQKRFCCFSMDQSIEHRLIEKQTNLQLYFLSRGKGTGDKLAVAGCKVQGYLKTITSVKKIDAYTKKVSLFYVLFLVLAGTLVWVTEQRKGHSPAEVDSRS